MIESPAPPRAAASERASGRVDGLRILIVDRHPSVRATIRRLVAARDLCVVAEVASADDAARVALETQPDVVLIENDLDGVQGHRVVRALHNLLPRAAIVVLAISVAEQDAVDAMRAGAMGFMELGIGANALQRAVRGAVRGDVAMSGRLARRLVQYLIGRDPREAGPALSSGLTTRELEILRLLADGLTAREAATVLGISTRTAEGHVGEILRRLGVRNRAEAVRRYSELV